MMKNPGTRSRVTIIISGFGIYSAAVVPDSGVGTCLENLEMSGNLAAVSEVSGKKSCQGKVAKTVYCCIFAFAAFDFAEPVHFILVLDHALSHSYPHHWQ